MSESVVFELKLQIQHLEEKLTFLAGGTNGAELVEVVMEKDEELEKNVGACVCVGACVRAVAMIGAGDWLSLSATVLPRAAVRCTAVKYERTAHDLLACIPSRWESAFGRR